MGFPQHINYYIVNEYLNSVLNEEETLALVKI